MGGDGHGIPSEGGLKPSVRDAIKRIGGLDRLAVSPQCGFASVDTGNPITAAAQEAKLKLVVTLAQDIWGTA